MSSDAHRLADISPLYFLRDPGKRTLHARQVKALAQRFKLAAEQLLC